MHICFTLSSLAGGGAERVASSLANRFKEMGHKVTLILVSIDYNNSFYELNSGIDVVPLLKTKADKKVLRRVKILKNKLLELNPDIVIAFLPHICIYSYFALKGTKIPLICSERNDPNQYNIFYKNLLKFAFKKSNGCVFQTQKAKSFYKCLKDDKTAIIYNPVNLVLSPNVKKRRVKDKLFVSVGRLTPQKNFKLLIDAFCEFSKEHKDYKLIIFGEGSLRQSLENQIKFLNLEDSVSLPGTNPKWHDVVLNASCFISSSNFEGMPNCLEEALCLGCPCIATNCPAGGSKELIELIGHGSLIDLDDKDELVNEMKKVIQINTPIKVDCCCLSIEHIANQWISFIGKIRQANN